MSNIEIKLIFTLLVHQVPCIRKRRTLTGSRPSAENQRMSFAAVQGIKNLNAPPE